MSDTKIVLNYAGIGQLLRSAEMRAVIEGHAQNMVNSLGDGYKYDIAYGSKDGRVRAFVKAESNKAKKENLEDNTILKAVNNG